MKKREIYTNEFVQAIKRKSATVLVKYIAVAVFYVTLCVAFCLLAAFDLLNVYVGYAFNVLLTIAFLWLSYLFFTSCFKKVNEKSTFVRCLENAYPSVYEGVFEFAEQDGQYLNLHFKDGNVLKLDINATNCLVGGKTYCVDVVADVVIAYGEVDNE